MKKKNTAFVLLTVWLLLAVSLTACGDAGLASTVSSSVERPGESAAQSENERQESSLSPGTTADGPVVTPESLGLADGQYQIEVELSGGSGRASVDSPALLKVEDGKAFAVIVWSSSNYDYMKIDEKKYEPITTEENSAFEIPVSGFDWEMPVIADTVAMSEPHEIDYTLRFDSSTIVAADTVPVT